MRASIVCLGWLAAGMADAQQGTISLVDSDGKIAGRMLNETIVLVAAGGATAPASIRAIFDSDGRAASGLGTWQSGGSVLFTSPDCSTGAHVYSPSHPAVRGAAQVETASGIMLYVAAIGSATTQTIHSVLYDTGCSSVSLRQNGLHPVVMTVNLTTQYPPPLSLQ